MDNHQIKQIHLADKELKLEGFKQADEVFIDKSKFDVPFKLLALRIPKQHSSSVSKLLSGYLFDRPRVRHIVLDPSNVETRLIVLSEKIMDPSLSELPGDKLALLRSLTEFEVVQHNVVLGYEYWPVEHVLKDLLPAGCEVPSSFETVGHIAHLNIREELIPYKKVIASVILDKNQPKIKTVVNKVGTITNEFRVPTFEVLAGEESLVTEVKQHGATFQLDYGLVYWNSRLEYEHKRLVSQFNPKQVICDMFAGIGPFAVPAAQKGCIVYANDLNPHSVKYLQINSGLNKLKSRIHTYNMDARQFMRELVTCKDGETFEDSTASSSVIDEGSAGQKSRKEETPLLNSLASPIPGQQGIGLSKTQTKMRQGETGKMEEGKPWEHIDHIVMNLPASALDFLDVFQGLFSRRTWKGTLPRIHCYCFMRAHETVKDVIKRAEKALNGRIEHPDIWEVRDVAPNKRMLCLSFDLPHKVGFGSCTEANSDVRVALLDPRIDDAVPKRPRTDS